MMFNFGRLGVVAASGTEGGGSSELPEPIAIADFKNGIYQLNGANVTVSDLFNEGNGFLYADIINGVGWRVDTIMAQAVYNYVEATPLLNDALNAQGATIVQEFMFQYPDQNFGVGVFAYDDDTDSTSSVTAAIYANETYGVYTSIVEEQYVPEDVFTSYEYFDNTFRDETDTLHRIVTSLFGSQIDVSLDGNPADSLVKPTPSPTNLPGELLLSLSQNNATGPAQTTIERYVFYPRVAPEMLPELSGPQPLAVLDFENETYTWDGAAKTLDEIFVTPMSVTPGVGWVTQKLIGENQGTWSQATFEAASSASLTTGMVAKWEFVLEDYHRVGTARLNAAVSIDLWDGVEVENNAAWWKIQYPDASETNNISAMSYDYVHNEYDYDFTDVPMAQDALLTALFGVTQGTIEAATGETVISVTSTQSPGPFAGGYLRVDTYCNTGTGLQADREASYAKLVVKKVTIYPQEGRAIGDYQ